MRKRGRRDVKQGGKKSVPIIGMKSTHISEMLQSLQTSSKSAQKASLGKSEETRDKRREK